MGLTAFCRYRYTLHLQLSLSLSVRRCSSYLPLHFTLVERTLSICPSWRLPLVLACMWCICCQGRDRERIREMVRRRAIVGSIGQIAYDIVTADRGQTQQAQNQAISSEVALWAWTPRADLPATASKSLNLFLFVLCGNLTQLRCQYVTNTQLVFDLCWFILWLCKILHVCGLPKHSRAVRKTHKAAVGWPR